jgi:protein-disulfide isomerase
METKKRTGRAKRLDSRREERRRQKRRQQLATILTIGGAVVLVIALIIFFGYKTTKSSKNDVAIGTVVPITPNPRPKANGNVMGDPNAPVKMVEYSDFQCPYCLRFYQEIEPSLITEYIATGKVHFTYRSMGYWIGDESVAAAEAAYCASDQNKFWEYHDILFTNWTGENVGDFNNNRLIAFAANIGLDMNAFSSCFSSHKYSQRVTQDHDDGLKAGVQGTPAFFINGKKYDGAFNYSGFKAAIDAALAGK